MSNIKPLQNEFAGIEGNYGVINQGTGYAVVNILTNEMKAHKIFSYLDALKTAEYLADRDKVEEVIHLETSPVSPASPTDPGKSKNLENAVQGLKADIRQLIKKYAPETINVDKSTNFMGQSRYKCFDASGNVLGRVRGKTGDRYWQYGDLSGQKYY